MSCKSIERSREARLWIMTIISVVGLALPIVTNPTVQGHARDAWKKTKKTFKKVFRR